MAGGSGSEVEASGLVNTLQGHIDDIRTSLQCGICIRPLYEPFTLACGHTFCYSCLTSWFSGGRSKRTCPDCRAPVKTQPAPAYLVRAVVQMFTSRAELLDKEETTAEHTQSRKEESDRLDKDKSNTDPYRGGLFGGLFKPKPPALQPIVDVDDGVARCPMCSWELAEDHSCQSCGWHYRPESEGSDLTDTDFTESDEYDSALEDEDGEEDDFGEIEDDGGMFDHPLQYFDGLPPLQHVWSGHSMHHHHPPLFYSRVQHYPRLEPVGALHTDDYDEEEEEDEDEYNEMDSFIDDGEPEDGGHYDSQSDHGTVVDATRAPPSQLPSRGPSARLPPYVPTDSEGEDSAGTEEPGLPGARRDSWQSQSFRESTPSSQPYVSSYPQETSMAEEGESEEDEEEVEDDDTDTDDPYANFQRARYYQPVSRLAANDGTAPGDSSSPPRPMRSARSTGATAHNAITIDDSDEDQPVGPMRRTAQRRQARFSPY